MKLRIVFVCSGNICRSPMAEAMARDLLMPPDFEVEWIESAGTLGIEGRPATDEAIRAVGEWGIDLREHRSKGIQARHLDASDFILAMAPEHVRELRMLRPAAEPRVIRLWTFTDRKGRLSQIDDPIGRPYKDYLKARDDISECLRNWLKTISGSSSRSSQ